MSALSISRLAPTPAYAGKPTTRAPLMRLGIKIGGNVKAALMRGPVKALGKTLLPVLLNVAGIYGLLLIF